MTSGSKNSKSELPPEEDWRAHGTHNGKKAAYPSISYYQTGDKIWYAPSGATVLQGPYTVVSHQGNEMYIIKHDLSGQQPASSVSKMELQRA